MHRMPLWWRNKLSFNHFFVHPSETGKTNENPNIKIWNPFNSIYIENKWKNRKLSRVQCYPLEHSLQIIFHNFFCKPNSTGNKVKNMKKKILTTHRVLWRYIEKHRLSIDEAHRLPLNHEIFFHFVDWKMEQKCWKFYSQIIPNISKTTENIWKCYWTKIIPFDRMYKKFVFHFSLNSIVREIRWKN